MFAEETPKSQRMFEQGPLLVPDGSAISSLDTIAARSRNSGKFDWFPAVALFGISKVFSACGCLPAKCERPIVRVILNN